MKFLAGLFLGMVLAACATTPFPYNYYGIDLKDQKLLGPSSGAYPDLPLATCEPSPASDSPCVAMLTPTAEAMIQNYENLQTQLIACQKKLITQ